MSLLVFPPDVDKHAQIQREKMRERKRAETMEMGGNFYFRPRSCNSEPSLVSHTTMTMLHYTRSYNMHIIILTDYFDEREEHLIILPGN